MDTAKRKIEKRAAFLAALALVLLCQPIRTPAQQDSTAVRAPVEIAAQSADPRPAIRGIERPGRGPVAPAHRLLGALFFLPRHGLDGLFYAAGRGAGTFADPEFVARVEDFFYLIDRSLGWYPSVSLASGVRPVYETTLFYRAGGLDAEVQGGYSGSDKWEYQAETAYQWQRGTALWSVTLGGLVERDDDLEFFGFGPKPREDARSPFLADAAARQGNYFQRREQLRLEIAFQPVEPWTWTLSSFYQKRAVEDPLREKDGLGKVFDLERLPGALQPTRQWYTELAAVLDTRPSLERIVPGMRLEGYVGLSEGVRGDPSSSWRSGADLAFFVPVIRSTRLIVPRLVVDQMGNRTEPVPLAFTEFPRHPLFRGVSARKLFRTDYWSLLSSLEYQWPVAPTLGGHLFADYLLVADEPTGLSPGEGVWAVGWGLDLHTEERDLAGVELAIGSHELRFLLTAGFSGDSDERSKQK